MAPRTPGKTIIFVNTKRSADVLEQDLYEMVRAMEYSMGCLGCLVESSSRTFDGVFDGRLDGMLYWVCDGTS